MTQAVFILAGALLAAGADDARVAAGEVVVTSRTLPGTEVPEATARALIDAPPARVWALVSNCNQYIQTMPNLVESVELARPTPEPADGAGAADVRLCRVVADLPFPFSDLTSVTRAVHTVDEGRLWQRRWRLAGGDYDVNQGSWRIEPYGADGARALVTYSIQAKPKVALPQWLISKISEGKLPEMMHNLRRLAASGASAPAR